MWCEKEPEKGKEREMRIPIGTKKKCRWQHENMKIKDEKNRQNKRIHNRKTKTKDITKTNEKHKPCVALILFDCYCIVEGTEQPGRQEKTTTATTTATTTNGIVELVGCDKLIGNAIKFQSAFKWNAMAIVNPSNCVQTMCAAAQNSIWFGCCWLYLANVLCIRSVVKLFMKYFNLMDRIGQSELEHISIQTWRLRFIRFGRGDGGRQM